MCTVKNSTIEPWSKSSNCLFRGFFRQGSGSSITCSQLLLLSIFPVVFPLWQDSGSVVVPKCFDIIMWIIISWAKFPLTAKRLFNQLAFFHHFLWKNRRREQGNLSKERNTSENLELAMFVLCTKSNRSRRIRDVFNQNLFSFPAYMFKCLLDESVSHI